MNFEKTERFLAQIRQGKCEVIDRMLATLDMNKAIARYETKGSPTLFRVSYGGLGLVTRIGPNPASKFKVPLKEMPKREYGYEEGEGIIYLLENDSSARVKAEKMMKFNAALGKLLQDAPEDFCNAGPIDFIKVDEYGFPTSHSFEDNGHPYISQVKDTLVMWHKKIIELN